MNDELADYWNKPNDASRRNEAIQAGRKRSVKDRLGELATNYGNTGCGDFKKSIHTA